MRAPLEERLWSRVTISDSGCWEWQGALTAGYGVIGRGSRSEGTVLTHRLAYELVVGPIPEDRPHIDHLCRNRRCCNPDHLEAVTQAENNRRAHPGPWTHCARGHEMTDGTTYKNSNGGRACAICINARARAKRKQRRAA